MCSWGRRGYSRGASTDNGRTTMLMLEQCQPVELEMGKRVFNVVWLVLVVGVVVLLAQAFGVLDLPQLRDLRVRRATRHRW